MSQQQWQALRGMYASGGKLGGRIVRPWYGGGPVAQQNRMTVMLPSPGHGHRCEAFT